VAGHNSLDYTHRLVDTMEPHRMVAFVDCTLRLRSS
jgi:hypothetical protein